MQPVHESDWTNELMVTAQNQTMPKWKNNKPAPACNQPPAPEIAERLVRETVRSVELLAELSARFPDRFKPVARRMPAWPVMRFKREAEDDGFWHILNNLQLGDDYPIDMTHGARSHPTSATGQYLKRWVERLYAYRWDNTEAATLFKSWPQLQSDPQLKSILCLVTRIPHLSKATSDEWCSRVLIPLIMLLDAGADEASCKEPALITIWRQSGVKSPATFKSRLLTKVRQTLRSLAKSS
jgi:hypothetical protein